MRLTHDGRLPSLCSFSIRSGQIYHRWETFTAVSRSFHCIPLCQCIRESVVNTEYEKVYHGVIYGGLIFRGRIFHLHTRFMTMDMKMKKIQPPAKFCNGLCGLWISYITSHLLCCTSGRGETNVLYMGITQDVKLYTIKNLMGSCWFLLQTELTWFSSSSWDPAWVRLRPIFTL